MAWTRHAARRPYPGEGPEGERAEGGGLGEERTQAEMLSAGVAGHEGILESSYKSLQQYLGIFCAQDTAEMALMDSLQ